MYRHCEEPERAKEADIKCNEEVRLSEDHRNVIAARPSKTRSIGRRVAIATESFTARALPSARLPDNRIAVRDSNPKDTRNRMLFSTI